MEMEITVDDVRYRLRAERRENEWAAYAERLDTGDRFGVGIVDVTADQAIDRLARWLRWQHEHAQALTALQEAEHAYHRAIAGSAFLSTLEDPTPTEVQKESLEALTAARLYLDEVRARRPA